MNIWADELALVLMKWRYGKGSIQRQKAVEKKKDEHNRIKEKKRHSYKHVLCDKATSACFPSVQQSEQCATSCGLSHAWACYDFALTFTFEPRLVRKHLKSIVTIAVCSWVWKLGVGEMRMAAFESYVFASGRLANWHAVTTRCALRIWRNLESIYCPDRGTWIKKTQARFLWNER